MIKNLHTIEAGDIILVDNAIRIVEYVKYTNNQVRVKLKQRPVQIYNENDQITWMTYNTHLSDANQ